MIFVIIGFVVSACVMSVFRMVTDSVLLCFATDEELHGKEKGAKFAPPQLEAVLVRDRNPTKI